MHTSPVFSKLILNAEFISWFIVMINFFPAEVSVQIYN